MTDFAFLNNVTPETAVLDAAALAIALAKGKDSGQVGLLGDFFSAVGDNLALISSQMELNTNNTGTAKTQKE